MEFEISNVSDYHHWTKKTFGQAILGSLIIFGILMGFTYLYDIIWVKIGYIFIYFSMFFLAFAAFWLSLKIRIKGIGLFMFGIPGVCYIPAGVYYEWIMNPIMSSPWGAVVWALKFVFIGLSLDVSIYIFKPQNGTKKSIFLASLLFWIATFVGTIVSLALIYVSQQFIVDFLTYSYFLLPFSFAECIMGSFAGNYLIQTSKREYIKHEWYSSWNKRKALFIILGTLLISGIIGGFTVFFDIVFMKIGYIFIYYTIPYMALILYYLTTKVRTRGIGLILFGMNGILGIPLELYFEWITTESLVSPWAAFGWAGIYALYGLSADLSLWLLNPQKREHTAILYSALIFSISIIITSIVALTYFYKTSPPMPDVPNVLSYAIFLIPVSVIEGILGAYVGYRLACKNNK